MQAQHTAFRGNIRLKRAKVSQRPRVKSDDLEFSEYGRDPHFTPGWFVLPILGMGMVALVIASFVL